MIGSKNTMKERGSVITHSVTRRGIVRERPGEVIRWEPDMRGIEDPIRDSENPWERKKTGRGEESPGGAM